MSKNIESIESPLIGRIVSLKEVKDEAFVKGKLGKGVAVLPIEGKIVAPVDGVVKILFPTRHVIAITSNSGIEILIHVGVNTVKLQGKYFYPKIKQGEKIKKGDLLLEFDIEKIKEEGFEIITPITIINSQNYLEVNESKAINAMFGEILLDILI